MVVAGFVPAIDFLSKAVTMLRRIVSMLIVVPLAVVIIAFAVANRQSVTVSFDPFSSSSPAYAATLPLFVLIFVLLILGVLVGGAAAWIGQTKWRRSARKLDGEVRVLHQELDAIRRRFAPEPSPAASEPTPYPVFPPTIP
jgi:uncharacterized integral membrane protein